MFRLLESLTVFDVISPIATLLRNLISGPTHTFGVPAGCGWSGRDVETLLRDHGVTSWCHMTINHTYLLTVKRRQAVWAQYVMDEAQVPVVSRRVGR